MLPLLSNLAFTTFTSTVSKLSFSLTANAITGMRESYIAQGFSEYIAKPIEKETLITVYQTLMT